MGVDLASSGVNAAANEFDAAETKGVGFGPPVVTVERVVLLAMRVAVYDVDTVLGTLELAAIRVWPPFHKGCKRETNVVSVRHVEKILHSYVS
jgi:hypothetical protein